MDSNLPLMTLISPTKRCNLRCEYCYVTSENTPSSNDMSLTDFHVAYKWLAEYCKIIGRTKIQFTWFGGEPLLRGSDFLESMIELQQKIFPDDIIVLNNIQTNLTLVDERVVNIAKKYFNSTIGGSLDICSGLRCFPNGIDSMSTVEKNLEFLRQSGIRFGIVSTLTSQNISHIEEIYEYFNTRQISFLLNRAHLPTFKKDNSGYLSTSDYNKAMIRLFEIYTHDRNSKIEVLNFTNMVRHYLSCTPLITCTDLKAPEAFLGIEASGRIYAWCRFGSPVGNYYQMSPKEFIDAYTKTYKKQIIPARCMSCDFLNKVCQGPCMNENGLDCDESSCGYRTNATREMWLYVQNYLKGEQKQINE